MAQSMLDQKVQGESAHKCWGEKREGAGSREAHLPHPQSNGHRRLRDLFLVCIWIQACLFLFSAVRALKRTLCLVVLVLPPRGLEQNTDYSHFLLKKQMRTLWPLMHRTYRAPGYQSHSPKLPRPPIRLNWKDPLIFGTCLPPRKGAVSCLLETQGP